LFSFIVFGWYSSWLTDFFESMTLFESLVPLPIKAK
jgi:hypothetical protein